MAMGVLALWPLTEARAITITINSAPNNTAITLVGSTTSQRAAAHQLYITDGGGSVERYQRRHSLRPAGRGLHHQLLRRTGQRRHRI